MWDSYRWVSRALDEVSPLIQSALGLTVGEVLSYGGDPTCGASGCVVELLDHGAPHPLVLKLTEDSTEAAAATLVHNRQQTHPGSADRFPFIQSVHLVDVPGLHDSKIYAIIREDIDPAHGLSDADKSAIFELSVDMQYAVTQAGDYKNPTDIWRWRLPGEEGLPAKPWRGGSPPDPTRLTSFRFVDRGKLRPIARAYKDLYAMGIAVIDIHAANVGIRRRKRKFRGHSYPAGLLVHDLGSASLSVPVRLPRLGAANRRSARRTAASRPCPRQPELRAVVEQILGGSSKVRSCDVIGSGHMEKIVRRHGWDDAGGVVGFHTPKDQLYVTHEWSLPHEWVHATGLVDDKLGIWLCEGLTEFVAQEASRRGSFPYRPTYPAERRAIEEKVAPAAQMDPLQMARFVVQSYRRKKDPAVELARKIQRNPRHAHLSTAQLRRALGPRSGENSGEFARLVSR
jgi:hypothetical protein